IAALVFDHPGLAVRCTAVIDPARVVAAHVRVDEIALVEREQERMAAVDVATIGLVGLRMGEPAATILDQFDARGNIGGGEYSAAMDRRAAANEAFGHDGSTGLWNGYYSRHCVQRMPRIWQTRAQTGERS